VAALAERAQVGSSAARVTASRMVERGDLVVLEPGRPAVLAIAPAGETLADKLDELARTFWDF
jgi:predicted transcriptional regulator of viral defense system